MAPSPHHTLLLQLAGEGGSISLYRTQRQNSTTYKVTTGEEYLEDERYSSEKDFNTLEEAIHHLCNHYPVGYLHPLTISPELILPMAQAIKQKRQSRNEAHTATEETNDQDQIDQLNQIEPTDWNQLSSLLQELDNAVNELNDNNRKYENPLIDSILSRIMEQVYNMKIVYSFRWQDWDEGSWLASFPDFDFSLLSPLELSKLTTAIARKDRFDPYYWTDSFADGMMQKILAALISKFQTL